SLPPTPTNISQLDLTELCKYRINDNDLELLATVGFGAFAEVWKGMYNGEIVAVKRLLPNQNADSNIESFINEIKLFATFNSPSIVRLIGVAWTTPLDLKCVMELMDLGDLRDYLVHHDKKSFTWKEKLECLKSIASGLNYLHSLSVVHRDLKSRNVLMDSVKGTKLVDFGVAKEDLYGTMTVAVGTFRWMAPEVLHDTSYNTSADVYSFGMVLTEMDSHQIPYQDIRNLKTGQPLADPAIIAGVMNGSIKPSFGKDCPEWITSLADKCLKLDPTERPTMYQVVAQLVKVDIE
ncbi:kinase, partial [Thraustotheca clavata]